MSEEKKPIDPTKIKETDLLSITFFVKVKEVKDGGNELIVEEVDSPGQLIQMKASTYKNLFESFYSAEQFIGEEKVSRSQAAAVLSHAYNKPFTVSFTKADGSPRILRGRLVRPEPLLGRSVVEDLDVAMVDGQSDEQRYRQVDHRTLEWLIVDGVRYVVK